MKFVAKLAERNGRAPRRVCRKPRGSSTQYGGCKRPSSLLALELRPRLPDLPLLLAIVALTRPPNMPPMSLIGQVTKVGFMEKTATVTVSRFIFHSKTGKVRITLVHPVAVSVLTILPRYDTIAIRKEQKVPHA